MTTSKPTPSTNRQSLVIISITVIGFLCFVGIILGFFSLVASSLNEQTQNEQTQNGVPRITANSSSEEVANQFLFHLSEGEFGLAYRLLTPSQGTYYSANHLRETIDDNHQRPGAWTFLENSSDEIIRAGIVFPDGSNGSVSLTMREVVDEGWRVDTFTISK